LASEKENKTGTKRQKVLIPNSSPELIYRALLSSKQHSAFTGSPAKINSRVRATFSAWDGYIFGKNIELQNGKKIVQE
jgi:activator of HSP90 ATPase